MAEDRSSGVSPDPNSLTPPPANRTKGPGRCDLRKSLDRFGALVDKVDFPKFIGDLIKDVLGAKVEGTLEAKGPADRRAARQLRE